MRIRLRTAALGVCLLGVLASGCAAGRGGRQPASIGERQQIQRGNIREGVQEGDLTPNEAARLRARQRDIADDRRDAVQDDGRVDPAERRDIKRQQQNLGDQIYQQRHDADRN